MGSLKLGMIRKEVRKSLKMTDAQLLAWFNRQMEARDQGPKAAPTEIKALRLLRDALKQEKSVASRKAGNACGHKNTPRIKL
jgi:hypothetical protein